MLRQNTPAAAVHANGAATVTPLVVALHDVGSADVSVVGGKNASLGELVRNLGQLKIAVPDGFATTAVAYWGFIDENGLRKKIASQIRRMQSGAATLKGTGAAIRQLILKGKIPTELQDEIAKFYAALQRRAHVKALDVAVRSSATAEDLPTASFAGQLESFLNIRGEKALLSAVRRCFASLFTDRAISYRESRGFDHMKVAVSVGVQRMVRSDKAGSGVMFSIDTETGFPNTVVINAAWGLGEYVVQGMVDPDEYVVFKPLLGEPSLVPIIGKSKGSKERKLVYARGSGKPTKGQVTTQRERHSLVLSDGEILKLAKWTCAIEAHYERPMDIEWAKDGVSDKLYIVQARPETVQSRLTAVPLKTYVLKEKKRPIVKGLAIGSAIAAGRVCRLKPRARRTGFRMGRSWSRR